MNDYAEVNIKIKPYNEVATDILSAMLADIGFESFVSDSNGLKAYIPFESLDLGNIESIFSDYPMDNLITFDVSRIPGENWNKEWEKNYFKPVIIGNRCVIHSSFHNDIPDVEYDIKIDPEMAFGTGSHETTYLLLEEILSIDLNGKTVLDMGCGTAILGILASMRGASRVTAIDIDAFAHKNACKNITLNNVSNITVKQGGVELLDMESFDVIFANINRNILLNDIKYYVSCMHRNSIIYFSGFYSDDLILINEEAERNRLAFEYKTVRNKWVVAKYLKIN